MHFSNVKMAFSESPLKLSRPNGGSGGIEMFIIIIVII